MKLNTQNTSVRRPACQRANRSAEKRVQDLPVQLVCAVVEQQAQRLADVPGDFEPSDL